jgi:hypothetical protein
MTAICISACGDGTVIVDFAVQAQVAVRDLTTQSEELGSVLLTGPSDKDLSRFDSVKYRGNDLEWVFGTGTLGMGGSITNLSSTELCLRFDQAQISSNLSSGLIPLSTFHWATFRGEWKFLGSTDPKQRHEFTPPALCLGTGEKARISFSPDLKRLFPTQRMFNVDWWDNEPALTQKGVGNWIAISLPVEVGSKRKIMDVRLTAIDSRARISNY